MRPAPGWLALACLLIVLPLVPATAPDRVHANDNRKPAGRLRNGVLTIALEVRMGRWYPEADDGQFVDLPVFAEAGRQASVPAPLIRVPAGTVVEATIANRLPDSMVTVQGFMTRPAEARDSLVLLPGETRTVRFGAGAPGTYFYQAWVGQAAGARDREQEQLAGAFIVDAPGKVPADRVFVINIWGSLLDSTTYRNAVTMNGKAWPYTERQHVTVGDSVRWRIVNPSVRPHPMHLHGFYFAVESQGTMTGDTLYPASARRTVVTEDMRPGHTMAMTWVPDRPGNWLFHCHIGFHVIPESARFDTTLMHSHDRDHMAGLVLGLEVTAPPGWRAAPRRDPARLRMVIEEAPPHRNTLRTIAVALGPPDAPVAAQWPGPLLVAERGRPLDVTVVNHLGQSTAIHWHGLELESFWDGVAGWSGLRQDVAPPILPADSFVAHLLVPRAGTFIYHTHLNDVSQLTAGLYGPLVVVEPGTSYDPRRDHLFTIGWDGDAGDLSTIVVNGAQGEPPLTIAAGVPQRLRFVNIGVAGRVGLQLLRDGAPARWQVGAVDGADIPASVVAETPARRLLNVGMTFDAIFTPIPGRYDVLVLASPQDTIYRRTLVAE